MRGTSNGNGARCALFFRNDDADIVTHGDRRRELYALTDVFLKHGVPLVHAVVPASVTAETVRFLCEAIDRTALVEVIQHGWSHAHYRLGEFDETRSRSAQYHDIVQGRDRLRVLFEHRLYGGFTAPYGVYTKDTFQILDECGFSVVSSSIKHSPQRRAFDAIGRCARQTVVLNKRIPYHAGTVPRTRLVELSTSVNVLDPRQGTLLPQERILTDVKAAARHTDYVGILFHHIQMQLRDMPAIGSLLSRLRERDYMFVSVSQAAKRVGGDNVAL